MTKFRYLNARLFGFLGFMFIRKYEVDGNEKIRIRGHNIQTGKGASANEKGRKGSAENSSLISKLTPK